MKTPTPYGRPPPSPLSSEIKRNVYASSPARGRPGALESPTRQYNASPPAYTPSDASSVGSPIPRTFRPPYASYSSHAGDGSSSDGMGFKSFGTPSHSGLTTSGYTGTPGAWSSATPSTAASASAFSPVRPSMSTTPRMHHRLGPGGQPEYESVPGDVPSDPQMDEEKKGRLLQRRRSIEKKQRGGKCRRAFSFFLVLSFVVVGVLGLMLWPHRESGTTDGLVGVVKKVGHSGKQALGGIASWKAWKLLGRGKVSEEEIHSNETSALHPDMGDGGKGSRGLRQAVRLYDWSKDPVLQREIKLHPIKTLFIAFYDHGTDESVSEAERKTLLDRKAVIEEAVDIVARENAKRPILHVRVDARTAVGDFSFFIPEEIHAVVPAAVIVQSNEGFRKFLLPLTNFLNKGDSAESLAKRLSSFEERFFRNQYPVWLRSEEPYPVDKEANVQQLTGKEFGDLVLYPRHQDALVLFYAPWCGHCKQFEPKFRRLAERFRGINSIAFYKLDITKNDVDHPDVQVRRVPHLRLFRARDNKAHPLIMRHAVEDFQAYGTEFLLKYADAKPIKEGHLDGKALSIPGGSGVEL